MLGTFSPRTTGGRQKQGPQAAHRSQSSSASVRAEHVELWGDTYACIDQVDRLRPFLMSVVSPSDHWLFVSSTGGIAAGRRTADHALFPYGNVDQVHDSCTTTGSVSLVRCRRAQAVHLWEPFSASFARPSCLRRRLYKNLYGTSVVFEETNLEIGLRLRYGWATSEEFGFVRRCELEAVGHLAWEVEVLDGVRNVLPAGTNATLQRQLSSLVDAYKRSEVDRDSGVAWFSLQAQVTDQPVPMEALRATTVWCAGLQAMQVTVDPEAIVAFARDERWEPEADLCGGRGAYLVAFSRRLQAGEPVSWSLVADVEQSQKDVIARVREVQASPASELQQRVLDSTVACTERLKRIVAGADGMQRTGQQVADSHHFANATFNVMRGGTPRDGYGVQLTDFLDFLSRRNRVLAAQAHRQLAQLPAKVTLQELLAFCRAQGSRQLERVALEYLPLFFGRRHGDPSRPWNSFCIEGQRRRGAFVSEYQGNWRDIFQNWEALARSYPALVEAMVARFLNASTLDGNNPLRLDRNGVDWERPEPDAPWANIGYWGDHQAVYLVRLLELAKEHFPTLLPSIATRDIFSFAAVPYRMATFAEMRRQPRRTVRFDAALDRLVAQRVAEVGSDGQLVFAESGEVYLVNLVEKLLILTLTKTCSLVPGGGVWMNTQRPEWNDANNALVGHGVSVVTACYLLRLVCLFRQLLRHAVPAGDVSVTGAVACLLRDVSDVLAHDAGVFSPAAAELDASDTAGVFCRLGEAGSAYRQRIYGELPGKKERVPVDRMARFLDAAADALRHTIRSNRREDGLYHTYNLIEPGSDEGLQQERLGEMLEGQVAALSCDALTVSERVGLITALRESRLYRADQKSYMLYPRTRPAGLLERGRVPERFCADDGPLASLARAADNGVVTRDANGVLRFCPEIVNAEQLERSLAVLRSRPALQGLAEPLEATLREAYEDSFAHRRYAGRASSMFAFEGVGCIYWHMVAKLLVAMQECLWEAVDRGAAGDTVSFLRNAYWQTRDGLGYRREPGSYGAFPADPYSHTPWRGGASQPGMTGQVKEELLTRWGELGLRLQDGSLRVQPLLLRRSEFCEAPCELDVYGVDGNLVRMALRPATLGFTFCQVPVTYELSEASSLQICMRSGRLVSAPDLTVPEELTQSILMRTASVSGLIVRLCNREVHP